MPPEGFKVCLDCLAHPNPGCPFCGGTGTYPSDPADADLLVDATSDGVKTTIATTYAQRFREWLREMTAP